MGNRKERKDREIDRKVEAKIGMHLLSGPLSRHLVILVSIGLISSGDLRHERVIRVRVAQERANRQ